MRSIEVCKKALIKPIQSCKNYILGSIICASFDRPLLCFLILSINYNNLFGLFDDVQNRLLR